MRKGWRKIKETYELLLSKKYTTIAGTLVFFFVMSVVPLTFWISLLVGRLPIESERILALPLFSTVREVLLYIRQEAENATKGASVILLITTLYSATTLFYQMRRTGEIVYDYRLKRKGIKMRLSAVVLLFLVIALTVLIILFFTALSFLFSLVLAKEIAAIVDYALLAFAAFALILLFNVYVCPYRVKLSSFLGGSAFTVLAWAVALVGFAIYLRFSNVSRLYGALSTMIVFLLWLYLLMIGFVVGVVLNSRRVVGRERTYNFL